MRSSDPEQAPGHREHERGLEAEHPPHFGFRGEWFEVCARHGLRGDRAGDGFGLAALDAGRLESACSGKGVEGVLHRGLQARGAAGESVGTRGGAFDECPERGRARVRLADECLKRGHRFRVALVFGAAA